MPHIRQATFPDAKLIDAFVAALPALRRDLDAWVNQADAHVALVEGDDVVGFAARARHKEHPQRDLVCVHTRDGFSVHRDHLLRAVTPPRKARPFKLRLPADAHDELGWAIGTGFTERIRSATHLVPADAFDPGRAEDVDPNARGLTGILTALYEQTHRWDPPAPFNRRYVRQAMLAGAQQVAVVRDPNGEIAGVGVAHASDDDTVAADISLVGALDPSAPDADAITAALVGHLATPYRGDPRPLWFEVDRGPGTNEPLARLVTPRATANDEIVILTTD